MASARRDSGRPRLLSRVVRRLIGRRSPHPAGGASGAAATPVGAGVVGALPVRAPWTIMRWWQGVRARRSAAAAAGAIGVTAASAAGESSKPLVARPSMVSPARPALAGRSPGILRRSTKPGATAGRAALTGIPPAGPDVRPGHELPMRPALGGPPSIAAPGSTAAPGRPAPGISAPGISRPGISAPGISAPGRSAAPGTRAAATSTSAGPAATGPAGITVARSPLGSVDASGSTPLAARPAAGPSVSNPMPAEHLRVLGSAPLPPGNTPDPSGAVRVSPARRSGPAAAPRPRAGSEPGRLGGTPPARVAKTESPRRKWEAAVSERPLEAPRALPTGLHAMAAQLSGRSRPPLFTTGPNTRHALTAAGALGATTGSVVHLHSAPTAGPTVSAVLAHELTHTRNPVRRPRFFLGGGLSSLLDDDERSALAAGARSAAGSVIGQGRDAASGLIGQGRQAASGLIGQGSQAVSGLANQGQQAAAGLISQGRAAMGDATSAAGGLIGQGRQMADGLIGQGRSTLAGAGETAAGIVDQLPVGAGFGAVGDMATRAARAAVMEAAASPMAAAGGLLDQAQGMAGGAMDTASGALSTVSGYADQAAGAASGLADQASGAVNGLVDQASGAANGFVDQATSAVSGAVSGAAGAAQQALDPDKVVEIVEQRLLREIERRGGRWAGVF